MGIVDPGLLMGYRSSNYEYATSISITEDQYTYTVEYYAAIKNEIALLYVYQHGRL